MGEQEAKQKEQRDLIESSRVNLCTYNVVTTILYYMCIKVRILKCSSAL
jgi:hypothetical protein